MRNETNRKSGVYETPAGAFETWEEAMARVEQMDMDHEAIKYVGAE